MPTSEPLERIDTPKELQQRCLLPGDGSQAAIKAISRAEQALEQLSVNFDEWMDIEAAKLGAARNAAKAAAFSSETVDSLYGASHDLKGQGTTLGYPFAADICASLCRILDSYTRNARLPAELVDQHVDAVLAIVRASAKGRDNPKASILASKLCDVTSDYLVQLSRLKPRAG